MPGGRPRPSTPPTRSCFCPQNREVARQVPADGPLYSSMKPSRCEQPDPEVTPRPYRGRLGGRGGSRSSGEPRPVQTPHRFTNPGARGNTASSYRGRTLAGIPLDDSVVGEGSRCDNRVDATPPTTTFGGDLFMRSEQTSPAGSPCHRSFCIAGHEDVGAGVTARPVGAIMLRPTQSHPEETVAALDEGVAARSVSHHVAFGEWPSAAPLSRSPGWSC